MELGKFAYSVIKLLSNYKRIGNPRLLLNARTGFETSILTPTFSGYTLATYQPSGELIRTLQ